MEKSYRSAPEDHMEAHDVQRGDAPSFDQTGRTGHGSNVSIFPASNEGEKIDMARDQGPRTWAYGSLVMGDHEPRRIDPSTLRFVDPVPDVAAAIDMVERANDAVRHANNRATQAASREDEMRDRLGRASAAAWILGVFFGLSALLNVLFVLYLNGAL